mmetsp:Transcript_2532/g.5352  ORF Transcript_2532/g.5352 Transcript_2532/m.5352 type:complete len:275 (+) Transcript_2532:234-1058(+)
MYTPWWAWYLSLIPRKMVRLSTGLGSGTKMGWNLRASAASFSICLYSESVVAPTQDKSPRASCGFKIEAASIEPEASPAPITMCSSSMKRITCPAESETSLSTALSRSSNSPLYLAPATSAPTSSAITRFLRIDSGTSPSAMRCANPSTTAVLPTPGSPIRTGLFFRRRESTCTVRLISSSRPSTGSSFAARASAVRSVPYLASASPLTAARGLTQVLPPEDGAAALLLLCDCVRPGADELARLNNRPGKQKCHPCWRCGNSEIVPPRKNGLCG